MASHKDDLVPSKRNNRVSLKGFDYIELCVGNAHQAAHFYLTTFGYTPVAPEALDPRGSRARPLRG